MRSILSVLLLLAAIAFLADAPIPREVASWLVLPPPAADSKQWNAANYSAFEWSITEERRAIVATNVPLKSAKSSPLPFKLRDANPKGTIHAVRMEDGWLVGTDAGEWGGALSWFNADGSMSYKIADGNVHGFYRTRAGLFATQGLAHLSLDYGKVVRLVRNDQGHWSADTYADVKGSPYAATTERDGSLLIVTPRQLVRVRPDRRVDTLVKDAFWWGMYPNSLIETASGDAYIGMRHGVARVRLTGPKPTIDWLLPNREFADAKPPKL